MHGSASCPSTGFHPAPYVRLHDAIATSSSVWWRTLYLLHFHMHTLISWRIKCAFYGNESRQYSRILDFFLFHVCLFFFLLWCLAHWGSGHKGFSSFINWLVNYENFKTPNFRYSHWNLPFPNCCPPVITGATHGTACVFKCDNTGWQRR